MSQHWVREHAAHAEAARGHHQSGPHATTTAALEHQQPRCAMLKLRRPLCFSQHCAAQRARSVAPGGPMACSASREAEAGRVSASRAGGHAPRTGERVARKSASRACICVTVSVSHTPPWRRRHVFFLFLLGASDTRIRTCYENTPCPHGVPALLDDNTRRIRSLEVADAYKEKTAS